MLNEAEAKIITASKRAEHEQTLKVLDALRKTRAARGGSEPLPVPKHLQSQIIITDDDEEEGRSSKSS